VSRGYRKVSKLASSAFSGHSATVHVSIDLGLRGPAITISSGCATGLDVMAWARSRFVPAAWTPRWWAPRSPPCFRYRLPRRVRWESFRR